jgi:hypothetical protein
MEASVEPILSIAALPEDVMQSLINAAISSDENAAYLAVRTADGLTLLRERGKTDG